MLPSVNLSADFNSQDTKKQISALKSQMASLRDAVEDELMNIGYAQLDANLKKKIDSIKEDLARVSDESIMAVSSLKANYIDVALANINEIKSNYVTTGALNAKIATLDEIYGSKAWLGALDAEVARIRDVEVATIKANYITAGTVAATYATITSLNSVNAKFNSLDASKITAGRLSVSRIADSNSGNNASWAYVKLQGQNSTYWANVLITPA